MSPSLSLKTMLLTAAVLSCGIASCGGASSSSTTDEWTQVIGDGFGTPSLNTVPELAVFDGYLYVSLAPLSEGTAKLFRSPSGDAGSWVEVTPPLQADRSIHSFGQTDLGGGYLWCGTGGADGGMIFRMQNGDDWTPIAHRGFGVPALKNATPNMVVFQGADDGAPFLYAAMNSHGGGQAAIVKRLPFADTDPDHWTTVHDFTGTQPIIDQVSWFMVWNETLYFATNSGAKLWQSTDGVTFSMNADVGNGFGDPTNQVIASMAVFGDSLYATTTNPTQGGQLWRTMDGASWEQITGDAFGKGPAVSELRSIRPAFGKLWVTGYTDTDLSAGTPIWRSDDGETWVQSNLDGFGDVHNNGQNAVVIGFGDHEYFGGPNYVDGGQLWRVKMR